MISEHRKEVIRINSDVMTLNETHNTVEIDIASI